ncbi:MAG: hypothetical protein IT348_03780 [Candidatus Eisenbacteria bacterium]|nr:hypothetical protein [Candidatus Eisenbacteria bacterium]
MRPTCLLAAILLLVSAAPARAADGKPAPPGRAGIAELIERVTDAYGGRAALDSVQSYRAEGLLLSVMRHSESPTIRVFARPDRFKVFIDYEGGAEARIVDGRQGWRNEPGGPLAPATGPMYSAMVLQAARIGVPWILYERADEATWTDSLTQDGVRCPGIEIPLSVNLWLRAWVSPVTGLVVRSQGLMSHGGMSTHFETVYSDHRKVGRVKFAFREENFASGQQTGVTSVRYLVPNVRLRPDEFSPPGAPPARPGKGEL